MQENTPRSTAIASPLIWLLRLEGLAVTVISVLLYAQVHARTGASWMLFGVLWLAPDLSALAYLAGPRWGARGYNAIHSYLLPSAMVVLALALPRAALLPYALIWFNHIGVDRFLGFGLKYSTGFGMTHLTRLGK